MYTARRLASETEIDGGDINTSRFRHITEKLVGKGKRLGCVLTLGHGSVQGEAGRRRSTCRIAARRPSTRCRGNVATVACGLVAAQGSKASLRHPGTTCLAVVGVSVSSVVGVVAPGGEGAAW
jgi:hypothetical protein